MFERFSETARRTLFFARYETTELGGMAIEAEHILLGLLRADNGPTPHLFAVADLSYTDARDEIRAHWGPRQQVPTSVEVPFSDQTERILNYAIEEADRLDHKDVEPEHLVLGVLREDGSFAAEMLRRHGMTLDALRDHIVKAPVVPEQEPETPAGGSGLVQLKREAFNAVVSVERIRFLIEELAGSEARVDDKRLFVDEIHRHLDELKRRLA